MCMISFKDGVVVELHDDGQIDIVSGSEEDVEFNFHYAMSLSTQDQFINEVSGHEAYIFNEINNRLGGILTP